MVEHIGENAEIYPDPCATVHGTSGWTLVDKDNEHDELAALSLVEVFFAGEYKRTVTLLEELWRREAQRADALGALFAGAPLVETVQEDGRLALTDVLSAYEAALELATVAKSSPKRGPGHPRLTGSSTSPSRTT
jgi:hypothetical protein